jgi:hypothetical protein
LEHIFALTQALELYVVYQTHHLSGRLAPPVTNFASLVKAALLGTTAATPIEIWFQDEARVGQKGTHAYIWAPIASRPLMVRDNRHDSAYIFGAICPARGVGAAVIMPAANAEGMSEHLKDLSTQAAPSSIAVVICDGAGRHQRGKELVVPDNIRLLSLPPYSPELNPMENVWDYLRPNTLWWFPDPVGQSGSRRVKVPHSVAPVCGKHV